MIIQEKIALAQYTTFKIGGPAKYFCVVKKDEELLEAIKYAKSKQLPVFVLGGGSNILISDSGFNGLVIKIEFFGIDYTKDKVTVRAGENWDNFVADMVEYGYCGFENLSYIPGTVGAAPVQNIGAYGVEVSNLIDSVRIFDTQTEVFSTISNKDCQFSYRDSIFKHQKGRYIITDVVFKLKRNSNIDISYKDLQQYFSLRKNIKPTIKEVREAIISIRKEKLPDWKAWGTAGSFFKNPIIGVQQYIDLKQKYPDMPNFPGCGYEQVKVSLGWILDKVCNAKGMFVGNAHVYEKQALVLVAKLGAKAVEVIELSKKIQDMVKEKTGIDIEAEVEWVV